MPKHATTTTVATAEANGHAPEVDDLQSIETLNIDDLMGILSDELVQLRANKSSVAKANAVANVTGKMFSAIKLRLEYARITNQTGRIHMMEPKHRLEAPKDPPPASSNNGN